MSLLDIATHRKVKSLAKNTCSSFIDGGCVFGGSCDYFKTCGKSISCEYFEESVLPSDKELEHEYKQQHGIKYIEKSIGKYERTCKQCTEAFKTESRNVLICSDTCRKQLKQQRNSMRKVSQS
ncbi:cysteine-rich VLP protein [Peribacillus frigoritolerans]|uniref:cysteine-rich VLP protein n=1 Tax=Peribacillus frigoritolerans TaxID=450367 RepID=UPI001F4F6679|nr:cysteine-rich VLP protein [Peribacillus frigoritolerans]MCK2018841.1 cysteine-rich VLP domain-containing protein [Peribacillus frigoritolerans]